LRLRIANESVGACDNDCNNNRDSDISRNCDALTTSVLSNSQSSGYLVFAIMGIR